MSWYNPKWEELSPRAKRLYILFMILIVCLVVFIVMIGTSHKGSDSRSSASRRVELTQDMIVGLTSLIQLKGFNCPEVKLAYQRDPDVYGDNSKVWCGPKDSDDVYEKAVFRVTITPKYDETKSPLDIRVVPWTNEIGNRTEND